MHTLDPNSENKYFYVKTWEKPLNLLNRKRPMRILESQNQRKTTVLLEQLRTFYLRKENSNNPRYGWLKKFK